MMEIIKLSVENILDGKYRLKLFEGSVLYIDVKNNVIYTKLGIEENIKIENGEFQCRFGTQYPWQTIGEKSLIKSIEKIT